MLSRHALAAVLGIGLFASASFAQQTSTTTPPEQQPKGEVNRRLERQQDRIQAGVKDDQLTKGEAARLTAHDEAIQKQEQKDRQANGGTLTGQEKKQINREENRNSRRIHRDRHNNRKPKA